ncbi:MAG: hypothetical protein Q9159_003612 [Coniocarpon cinnabarinum]
MVVSSVPLTLDIEVSDGPDLELLPPSSEPLHASIEPNGTGEKATIVFNPHHNSHGFVLRRRDEIIKNGAGGSHTVYHVEPDLPADQIKTRISLPRPDISTGKTFLYLEDEYGNRSSLIFKEGISEVTITGDSEPGSPVQDVSHSPLFHYERSGSWLAYFDEDEC